MIQDLFLLSYRNLKRRKLRTFLTLLGIVIGVSAVVALISVAQGMQLAVESNLASAGFDRLTIIPGGSDELGFPMTGYSASKLYEEDVEAVKNADGIYHAFGIISTTAKVVYRDEVKHLTVYGVPTDSKSINVIESIGLFGLERGEFPEESDKNRAVIASGVAKDVFDNEADIGDKIIINRTDFRVSGIMEQSGSPVYDRIIAIPIDTARILFEMPEEVSTIYAQVEEGYEANEAASNVERELRKERDLKEGDEDFSVQTEEQTISGIMTILAAVQGLLIGIAAISLLVGGVGIMNTMYTSVLEQTGNIGLMKAVGAKSYHIMLLFLIESGIVGLIGGTVGTLLGAGIGKVIELVAGGAGIEAFSAAITPLLVAGALAFSFLIGTISGLLPARQAASMEPIDALRQRR